jgi:hypothetical protein
MFRRFLTFILFLALIVSSLSLAFSGSVEYITSNRTKLDNYAVQTNAYKAFINSTVTLTDQTLSSNTPANLEPQIKAAAMKALPQSEFNTYVKQILNANLNWAEGKTSQPEFQISLSKNKAIFTDQIGQYVQKLITALPACTTSQTLALVDLNPLDYTCSPSSAAAADASTLVENKISFSSSLISYSSLSPSTLSKYLTPSSTVYYKRYSSVPKHYRMFAKVVYVFLGIALLSSLLILALNRSKGLKWIKLALVISGVILIIFRLTVSTALNHIDSHISPHLNIDSYKDSAIQFINFLIRGVSKSLLLFGLAYLLIAFVLTIPVLFGKRPRRQKIRASKQNDPLDLDENSVRLDRKPAASISVNRNRAAQPDIRSFGTMTSAPPVPRDKPRRRDLIQ